MHWPVAALLLSAAFIASPAARGDASGPWRLRDAVGAPWLRLGLEHRTRFEHLADDFRTANPGDASALSLRTLVSAEARLAPVVLGVELIDARVFATRTTPLNTTHANPLDLLQGYAALRDENVFVEGDVASLAVGRMTMDLGSRRLLARNDFRNTINAFTGIDLQWTSPRQDHLRVFAVVPVTRLPTDAADLGQGTVARDRENTAALLWAAFWSSRPVGARTRLEAFVVGLSERDTALTPSSDRRLWTPGLRALRPPATGEFDGQLEVMGQFGRSRATSAASDTTSLDHRAFFLHASMGHRFDTPWSPRLVLQFDHASGDGHPDDRDNNRFDPLFGVRRFELGPTGLFGPLARSNLTSPGLRLELAPHPTLEAFVGWRLAWLASVRDAWLNAPLRDPTGQSGRDIGQQLEARLRWQVLPGNMTLEIGAAVLSRGPFAHDAPDGRRGTPTFVYTQVVGTL